MGSSSSRPTMYPFPMPRNDPPLPSKSGLKWSLSSRKKSKKGKDNEKLDDFIIPKYPTPTTTYPFPYCALSLRLSVPVLTKDADPQMQPAFPGYYAPVQMAFVQPFGVQQPVLPMPQAYVPMVTAPPVQPPVAPAPAVQPAPMQMPVPAPAPAPAPAAPAPAFSSAPPPTAPTQMPQPHPPPPSQGPVLPPSPVLTQPVIPPPPIVHSEPPRYAPDSGRIRFTDFYRPADTPSHRRPSIDEPVRPSTAGPPGRTPFSASMPMPSSTPGPMPMPMPSSSPGPMPMPMPGTISRSNNPLPQPPVDIWDTSPYRHVLASLPAELPDLLGAHHPVDVFVDDPEPIPRPSSRLAGFFGSKDKGKKPMRGLFRSRSSAGQNDFGVGPSGSRHGHSRSQTLTSILIPAPGPNGTSTMDMPTPAVGPPIKFDHTGDYAGFVNHSPHRVMYKNKMYPTALHLLEAMKFTHQPALQERIRTCKDVNDMYPLSASFQEHVRSDWGQVFLKTVRCV